MKKIIFHTWLAEAGNEYQSGPKRFDPDQSLIPNPEIAAAVGKALAALKRNEQTIIKRFYFDGRSSRQIAAETGYDFKRVESIRHLAVNKLRKLLAAFVNKRFGVILKNQRECIICNSPHRRNIDRLILEKKKEETWKRIIKTLRTEYNIVIKTPQTLIGHRQYHL